MDDLHSIVTVMHTRRVDGLQISAPFFWGLIIKKAFELLDDTQG